MIQQAMLLSLFLMGAFPARATPQHSTQPPHRAQPAPHTSAPAKPTPTPPPVEPPYVRSRTYEYDAPKVQQIAADICWGDEGSCYTGCENGIFEYGVEGSSFCKSTTTAAMSFVGVGADGTQLKTEISALNPQFKTILSSARPELRVRASWKLDSCDGVKIGDPAPAYDIEEVIRQLTVYDFSQYMSCKFTALNVAASEEAYGLKIYPTYLMSLTILDNDSVQFESDKVPVYFSRSAPVNADAETAANEAAATLVDIVKNYGALLVDLRDAPTPDRQASLLSYLAQNKQTLITSIQTIDKNLPSCSTMTKLNINFSIKRGYSYIHSLEAKLMGSYPFGDLTGQ